MVADVAGLFLTATAHPTQHRELESIGSLVMNFNEFFDAATVESKEVGK